MNVIGRNEYKVNVGEIQIANSTFYWDNANVWVADCEMGVNKNKSCTMRVTSNYADKNKAPRQYAWYRVHVTFKSKKRTFYAVSDIGCSRFGDPKYIRE